MLTLISPAIPSSLPEYQPCPPLLKTQGALSRILCCLSILLVIPIQSYAGGLEIPDNGTRAMGRGGAYTAAVNEPSAIYYNPAALTLIDGFALTLNTNLWFYDYAFQREALTVEYLQGEETEHPFETTQNENRLFPAPMLFLSHDFGLENWGFGFGVYGPSGIGRTIYPTPDLSVLAVTGTEDTSPRDWGHGYMIEQANMLLAYISTAVAYDFGPLQLGATLQLAVFDIEFQNGGDGGGTLSVSEQSQERPELYARNTLRGSDLIPTAILGLSYRPLPQLTISASYRPRFHIVAEGDVSVDFPEGVAFLDLAMADPELTISLTMPDIIRGGIQWVFNRNGREFADIELDLVWERWSMTENFLIEFEGYLYAQESAYSAIVGERDVIDVEVPKYFNDTLSVRIGGDVRINDALTVRTGSFYEGGLGNFFKEGATAPGYANLDFLSFRRIGLSLGASYEIGDWSIDLAAMHIFSPHFEEENGQLDVIYPLWICNDPQDQNTQDDCDALEVSPLHPVNNGGYDASYDLVSLGFTLDL